MIAPALEGAFRDKAFRDAVKSVVKDLTVDAAGDKGPQRELGAVLRQGLLDQKTSAALRKLAFDGANAAINPFFRPPDGSPSRAARLAKTVATTPRKVLDIVRPRDQIDFSIDPEETDDYGLAVGDTNNGYSPREPAYGASPYGASPYGGSADAEAYGDDESDDAATYDPPPASPTRSPQATPSPKAFRRATEFSPATSSPRSPASSRRASY